MLEARRALVVLAVGVAASVPSWWLAAAEPYLAQPPNGGNGSFADLSCGACGGLAYVVADSFTLAQATTLRQVVLWGGHDGNESFPDAFSIWVYPDAGGLPGSPAAYYQAALTPLRAVATGAVFGTTNEIAFTLQLADPPVLAAGTWWLELANDSTDASADFIWEAGTVDPEHGAAGSVFSIDGSPWYATSGDFALLLDVDLFVDGFESGDSGGWSTTVP